MITVKYGSKSFEVKANKIYTPSGITLSESLSLTEVEVAGKKPTTTVKGISLQSVSMSVVLDCRFVTVETEIKYWQNILKGKSTASLKIGNYTVGTMILTSYKVSEITITRNGTFTRAVLELSFTEYNKAVTTTTTSKTVASTTVKRTVSSSTTTKVTTVKASVSTTPKATVTTKSTTSSTTVSNKVRKGSTIKPKSGVRWYYTAEGALKRTGKSGSAYQKNMAVTYTYSKSNKIVCVNPSGLGWLKVEDVTVVKY